MPGRVNTRFVIILAASIVVLVGGLGGFWYFFIYGDPAQYEARGDAAAAQGNWDEALQQYARALGRRPSSAPLTLKYTDAVSRATVSDAQQARRYLEQMFVRWGHASELDPSNPEPVQRLMALYLRLGRELGDVYAWDRMLERSNATLGYNPDLHVARKFRGIAQANRARVLNLSQEERDAAREDLNAILEIDPDDAQVLFHLSLLDQVDARALDGPTGDRPRAAQLREESRQRLREALARHPEDRQRKLDLVLVLVQEPTDDAIRQEVLTLLADLERSLLADPQPAFVLLSTVDLMQRAETWGHVDGSIEAGQRPFLRRAEALLSVAVETHPNEIRYLVALGAVQQQLGRTNEALASFDKARQMTIAAEPVEALRASDLRLGAAFQYGNLKLTIAAQTSDESQRQKLLDEVDQVLRQIRAQTTESGQYNLLAGKLALARNDAGEALKLLTIANSQFQDRNPEALLLSARAAALQNEQGAAIELLEKLLGIRPDLNAARYELARLYLQVRENDKAAEVIDRLLALNPQDEQARRLKSALSAQRGDIQGALALQRELDPVANPELVLPTARLMLLSGQTDEARQMLTERFEQAPNDLGVLQLLLRLTEDRDASQALLDRAAEAGVDQRAIHLLRSQLDETFDPIAVIQEQIEAETDPVRQNLMRYALLSRTGKPQEARAALAAAARSNPDHAEVVEIQFSEALAAADWPEAERLAARAGRLGLDDAEGLFYTGRLELARNRTEQAVTSFRRGLQVRPIYSEGHRQLGDALMRSGDPAAAMQSYRTAANQQPTNIAALRGLAAAANALGDHAAAITHLRRALQFASGNRELIELYLTYEATYGDVDRAVQLRRQLAEAAPDDLNNRRALALLLARQGQIDEGRRMIDGLLAEEGPTHSNVVALASIRQIGGDPEGAAQVMNDFLISRGAEATSDDHLLAARFMLQLGRGEEAMTAYQRAITLEDPTQRPATRELADLLFDRGGMAEAVKLYSQLHEQDPTDRVVAMRYAEALVRGRDIDKAQAVLQQTVSSHGETVESLMMQAVILASREQRAEAIRLLDRAEQMSPNSPMLYLQRAQLRADDPQADNLRMADLNRALELNPDLVAARMLRAGLLISRGDRAEATRELNTLINRAPDYLQARLQLADMYLKDRQYTALRVLLEESARRFPQDPTWPRLMGQAALAEGRPAEATGHYRKMVELSPAPQHVGTLALHLLDQRQPQPAIDLLRDHVEQVNAVPLLQAVRGRALVALDRAEEGRQVFLRAFERCQSVEQVLGVARQMRIAVGDEQAAQVLAQLPSARAAWWTLAHSQYDMDARRWSDAIRRLVGLENQLRPGSTEAIVAMQMLALSLYQNGQVEMAREAYEELKALQPGNVGTLNNLAYLLVEDLDQPTEGLKLAEQAAALAPDNPQVLDTLGWAQFKVGRIDDAVLTLRRSIRLEALAPNHYHLAEALLASGDRLGATRMFNTARDLAEQSNDQAMLDRVTQRLAEMQP